MRWLITVIIILIFIPPAYADRPVTPEEQAAIQKALAEDGCTGGSYEVDDEDNVLMGYEVDDAQCSDGALYDIDLDENFNIISKDQDD
ncbi:MAG: hypothetical protein AB4058_12935 [Microcystaceae cyanobacterium]